MNDPHSAGHTSGGEAQARPPEPAQADSARAWRRLVAALLLSTLGGVGMWSVVVALPAVQAEFGVARADASLPYTFTMICFGLGGMFMGRLSDRFGVVPAVTHRSRLSRAGLRRREPDREPVAVRLGAGASHRVRQLRHLRPAHGRCIPLVHAPARHRGGHYCQRQLSVRHALAAGAAALHRHRGLARDLPGGRRVLPGHHAAGCTGSAGAGAERPDHGGTGTWDARAPGCRRARCRFC